ncbi:MAG: ROK family protein [Christensenellales bacterium]
MREALLALDMGGSKYMAGLVTPDGQILDSLREEWESLRGDSILPQVTAAARRLLRDQTDIRLLGVGATIPGLTDARNGIWLEASFSGIRDLPVAEALSCEFGVPAYADNDAQACALAEKLFGGGRDCRDFIYLTLSNGVGGAAFSGDRLISGSRNCAMELGHCPVVPGGRPCGCGSSGCLEMYAAGPGITRTYRELTGSAEPVTGKRLAELARQGDPAALSAFRKTAEHLGFALSYAVNLLNPEKVIIGGGLSLALDVYRDMLQDALSRHCYRAANPGVLIQGTALGYEGALLGAAAVCLCRMAHQYYD